MTCTVIGRVWCPVSKTFVFCGFQVPRKESRNSQGLFTTYQKNVAMDNQLVRLFIFIVLLFLLTADIKDILQALSTTATLGPYLTGWRPSHHHIQRRSSPSSGDTSSTPSRKVADKELGYKSQPQVQGGARLKVFYPSPKGRKKLRDIEATGTAQQEYVGRRVRHISQEEIFATLTGTTLRHDFNLSDASADF